MEPQWSLSKQKPPTSTHAANNSTTKNYRAIYDPDLDRGSTKQASKVIYRYEGDTDTKTQQDPRLKATNYGKGLSKGQKSYRKKLVRVRYQHDEYSLESESLTTVLLTNLSPLTSEAQIATYLSVYGQVDRVEIKRHPATGGSLGIALVVFGDHGQAAATKAIGDGTRKMGQASNVQIKYDPTGEKLKAAIAESSNNMNESTNMNDHTAKPTLVSGRTATLSPPPPPVDSYSKRTYGSTHRYDADHVDRETSRWSKYDDNYRYQQHSREHSDRRYYHDDRYRGSSSLYHHPSSSPSSHPPYNHDLDRYFSASRSSSSFYGTPPPMPPGTSKWDQSKQTPSSGSAAIYSTYNSRHRSRSPSRGAGRRDISRGRYEGGYSSKHRMAYDSTNWDRDWERRRKPSDSWTASARDDSRQSREERRPSSTENQASLMISRKNLPFVRGVLEELRKGFYPHRYLDIYHDENAWFIVFDSITVAKRALTAMEGQSLLGYDLHITLQNSSTTTDSSYPSTTQALSPPNRSHDIPTPLSEATPSSTSPKLTDDDLPSMTTSKPNSPLATEPVSNTRTPDNTTSTTTIDTSTTSQQMHAVTSQSSTPKYTNVRDHAKQILLDQLSDVFLKDLKNRVVGPCIYDFLNPALHKNRTSNKRLDSTSSTTTNSIKNEPLTLPSSLSTDTDITKAFDQTSTNDQPIVSTSSETTAVMTAPIMNEEEELFGLPKPEENFAEGTLPSLNKLPKFKKRTNRSSEPQENGTSHTRKRLHQRISSPPPKRPCDDNSNLVEGENHMDRLNGNSKHTDCQKKRPSTTPTESDTSSPPILPTTEKSAGANFFSNSEDDGGSLAATAYQSTDDEKQQNQIWGRKKQRRVRNFVSSDDDEGDQNHHAHETFLRQLHKTATMNDDQTDVKTEAMEINGDLDMDLDDYGRSDSHKKRSKLKKRHKRINEQQQHESLDDSVSVSSNISKGEHKPKKGTLSPWKQRKLTEVTKNNKGSDMDIDIGGTSDDEVDTHLRQPKQHQQHSYDENGMVTGDEDDEGKKPPIMMTHLESNELDQEAYERMLLEPDSSCDEDEKMDYGGNEQVNDLDLHPDWDPFRLVQDGEDFGFLRLAILEKLGFGANIPEMDKVTEKVGGGCARSRGYSVISDAEKATYLPKNMAVVDDTASLTASSGGGVGRLTSSRANRVNNRRFVVGMVMQKKTMADSDILKFNQLKGRKKHLRFAKSPIHDWGLYAEEHIDANDMVIEYVGEVIRQQVAEEREKIYERCGIGSSYLFRVDDDIVIDATKKGSIARFINHCCSPNCSAKIITVDKQKKIVIYANRDIEPGEEITYDYKFPLEDDKIPCLCGSKYCKGTLN